MRPKARMKLRLVVLALLVLWAAAVVQLSSSPAHGERGRSSAAASGHRRQLLLTGVREAECNYINERDLPWIPRRTAGYFPPYQLAARTRYNGTSLAREPLVPFRHDGRLAFSADTLYVVDNDENGIPQVYSIFQAGLKDAYLPAASLARRYRGSLFDFSTGGFVTPPWELYKQPFIERRRLLSYDANFPAHLSAGPTMVAWTDLGGPFADLRFFSSAGELPYTPNLPAAASRGVHRTLPTVCYSYILFQEFDPATSLSSVRLYYMATGAEERLGPHAGNDSFFAPAFGADDGGDSMVCRAAFAQTSERLAMGPGGNTVPASGAGLADATLHLVEMPMKERRAIPAAAWRSGRHTRLVGFAPSQRHMLLALSSEDASSYTLRALVYADGSWQDVPGSDSPLPPTLAGADSDAFLVWRGGELWAIRLAGQREDPWHVLVCRAARAGAVDAAAVYKDMVVFASPDGAGGFSLSRIDFDKDNDQVWDAVDRFPLDGDDWHDSDNDGIGDNTDIIDAAGPCVASPDPSACMSETVLLHILSVVFILLLTVPTALLGLRELKNRSRVKPVPSNARRLYLAHYKRPDERSEGPQYRRARFTIHDYLLWFAQGFILLLTALSIALAIVPLWSLDTLPEATLAIFTWTDWYIMIVFIVDLVARFVLRDRELCPTARAFFRQNWYDVPSLVTDVPGASTFGAFNWGVALRLARFWRFLRVMKFFRFIRLYKRLSQQSFVVLMTLERPLLFLSSMATVLIVLGAIFVKIVEQEQQSVFAEYGNAVWFSLVTIGTVGYGDLAPSQPAGRAIAMIVAAIGIGLLGALSAKLVQGILKLERSEALKEKRRADAEQRKRRQRVAMERLAQEYNPLNASLPPDQRTTARDDLLGDAMDKRLERKIILSDAMVLPLEEMMAAQGSYNAASASNRNRRLLAMAALLDRGDKVTARTRLHLLLRHFRLHKEEAGVGTRFAAFEEELAGTVLRLPEIETSLYLGKVMAAVTHLKGDEGRLQAHLYDTADTLEATERMIDETLIGYGLADRVDFDDIRRQLLILAMLWERIQCAEWAVKCLSYKTNIRPAPPATNSKYHGREGGAEKRMTWKLAVHKIGETRGVVAMLRARLGGRAGALGGEQAADRSFLAKVKRLQSGKYKAGEVPRPRSARHSGDESAPNSARSAKPAKAKKRVGLSVRIGDGDETDGALSPASSKGADGLSPAPSASKKGEETLSPASSAKPRARRISFDVGRGDEGGPGPAAEPGPAASPSSTLSPPAADPDISLAEASPGSGGEGPGRPGLLPLPPSARKYRAGDPPP